MSHLLIVFRLEIAEEARLLTVKLIVRAVQDGGDPADVRPAPVRDEELHLGVAEEGVLWRQHAREIVPERGDPMRVSGVDRLCDVEEAAKLAPFPPDPLDPDAAHRTASVIRVTTARSDARGADEAHFAPGELDRVQGAREMLARVGGHQ